MKYLSKIKFYFPWLLVGAWMILIYSLSAQPAHESSNLSNGLTMKVVEKVEKVTPNMDISLDKLNRIVRKHAHFFIYLVLGVFVQLALRISQCKGIGRVLIGLAICILYAASDEFHQLYVPGRGAQISDVLIDSAGAMVGVGLFLLMDKLVNKSKQVHEP